MYLLRPLADGILTGLFLQLAVGPVFFYILGITMDSNYINGLSAVIAVTLADYIFIILSLMGMGRLLRGNRTKTVFGLVSSVILLLFGLMIFSKGLTSIDGVGQMAASEWTPVKSFTSCFILTISSPLTIVFWGSIFSTKAIEKKYHRKQLVVFGLGAGASTFVFLSLTMLVLYFFKSSIPGMVVRILNCMVGMLLIYYGISRTVKAITSGRTVYCK